MQNTEHKTKKTHKDEITGFPKEQVENADFDKFVMNKIMTRHD